MCMHPSHPHTHTHTPNDCSRNWVLILVGVEILWEEEGFQLGFKKKMTVWSSVQGLLQRPPITLDFQGGLKRWIPLCSFLSSISTHHVLPGWTCGRRAPAGWWFPVFAQRSPQRVLAPMPLGWGTYTVKTSAGINNNNSIFLNRTHTPVSYTHLRAHET